MEVLNLRQYGIGAILHLHCRFNANHKVELLQTARMPVGAMAREVEKIFDCQAQELSLARVDLASDVPGITVGWFRDHMRVKHKRSMREIAARTNEAFANGGTTLYFGGGSDIVRVYDKIAQLQHQSGRIGRGGPSQYTNCMESGGLPTKGSVLTRIERQMRRIPNELATLNDLQRNASRFNPFKSVVLFSGGKPKPNPD